MKRLVMPAVVLLNRLTYLQKFALITLLFALPLGLTIQLLFTNINSNVDTLNREITGTTYLHSLNPLSTHVIQDKLLAREYLNGGRPGQKTALLRSEAQIDRDFQA